MICTLVLCVLCRAESVVEPTNYTKLRKSPTGADNLANLSPYNPIVREILKDFKPTNIQAKIIQSLAITITYYIKFVTSLEYIGV
jgi:hypothetical protein